MRIHMHSALPTGKEPALRTTQPFQSRFAWFLMMGLAIAWLVAAGGARAEPPAVEAPLVTVSLTDAEGVTRVYETGHSQARVARTIQKRTDLHLRVSVGSGSEPLSVTAEHPFWVISSGWLEAEQLSVGDRLVTHDGDEAVVQSIVPREGPVDVFNLDVEAPHNYYVRASHESPWALVHNKEVQLRGPRLAQSLGAARGDIRITSNIRNTPYAKRLARSLSEQEQRRVDSLINQLFRGNPNPGIGTRALGRGYFELRAATGERVIVKQLSANHFDVVAKFSKDGKTKAWQTDVINRTIGDYEQ